MTTEHNQPDSTPPARKSRGGRRPGAGRPKGSAKDRAYEIASRYLASGSLSPLEVLLESMHKFREAADDMTNDASTEVRIRLRRFAVETAQAAAPYVHPKLQAIEHTGADGTPLKTLEIRFIAAEKPTP